MNDWTLTQFLNKKECQDYLSKLNILQPYWIKRSDKLPFYTLGLAAYLDKNLSYNNQEKREYYNKILLGNFNDLYKKLEQAISGNVNFPTEIYHGAAFPGFHLYLKHTGLKSSSATQNTHPHIDTQFKHVFPEIGYKLKDFLSFTLTLECPIDSGLNIWKPEVELPDDVLDFISQDSEVNFTNKDALSKYAAQSVFQKPTFIKYNPGSLLIHHGVFYHYPILNADKGNRITLQGHGIKKDGKFLLFW